ncbi:MAG TPA: carboxypeptidase regulatory-like domain-containing protein [Pseudacidobacterium sp.]|nr:carboxypeptidase regulatory-like domain-containing protein [Pseudacidobacterium sp.]
MRNGCIPASCRQPGKKYRAALLAIVLAFLVYPSHAQEFRSVLTGLITDPSGALITNATVTAVNNASGTSYTAQTSSKGVYYIPYMLPGTYTVTVQANGFKTAVQDKVLLLASQTFNQNFTLELGSVAQQVVVNTAPPQLETTTGSGGTVIDQRTLQSVPLNGGQSYMLIGTTPGSQFTQTQFGTGGYSGTRGWDVTNSYTIGGGIVGNNQFTLNGTNITSQFGYDNHSPGEWTVSPNIDSIEEVNVMTTTYDARYGRTSGGTVNVVTKSGGDQYHASARYAYEGAFMNANTFQNNLAGSPRQGEVQNQWWITAGGPIIRRKLFFFFGFEGYRQSLAGSTLLNVPPAYLRPGYNGNPGVDFSQVQKLDPQEFPNGLTIFQPGTATCLDGGSVTNCQSNHVVQTPYPNNTLPGSQINATSQAVLKYIPLPNIPGTENLARGANYLAHTPDLYNYNQPQVRVDYNLTDKTKLYSYFLYWKGNENRSQNGLTGIASHGNINWIHQNWVATQDVTHVFSPTLVGDFKVAFDRFFESSPDGDFSHQTDPSTIGLAMPLPDTTSGKYLPEFNVNDGWGTGFLSGNTVFGNQLNADVTNNYVFNADFTKTAGAHTLEFGGEIDEFQYGGRPYSGGHPNGSFGFNSGWTQFNPHNGHCYPITPGNGNSNGCTSNTPNGSSLASFYLGLPSSGGVDWIYSLMEGYPVYAVYFQDNWRVNHRLTLNLGLRYDVQRGLRERYNHLNRGMCLTCVNPLTNDPAYQANVANAANIAAWQAAGINPGSLQQVLGGIQFAGSGGQSRDAYDTDWSDVGPRIGFAFVIDPKTVVRGGWGLMYSYGLEGGSSVGEAQTTNYTASLDGGNTPTNYFQTGQPFASGLIKPTGNSLGLLTDVGNGGVQVDFPNRRVPTEQILSFGIQRELPWAMVLDARYAGNFSSRLRTFLWINGTATLAQLKAAQANPQIWDQQVPNPYFNVPGISGPGQCGTSSTVQAIALVLPLSQYCSPGGTGLVGQYNAALGRQWYDGLEVKLTKRANHGLTFNMAYTYSKTMNGNGYQNGWPYQDISQIHQIADTDRTHVFSLTSVWDLPFGKGGLVGANSSRLVNSIIGGWTLSGVFNAQSGMPVGINTGWWYTCPGQSYRPKGGTSVGQGRWFNQDLSCWQSIPEWGLMNLKGKTAELRNPMMPNLDASIQKSVPITEKLDFQLRLDAFNAFNSVLFGGPNTDPGSGPASYSPTSGWSGFGTVGPTQQNFPRILQISGKISF